MSGHIDQITGFVQFDGTCCHLTFAQVVTDATKLTGDWDNGIRAICEQVQLSLQSCRAYLLNPKVNNIVEDIEQVVPEEWMAEAMQV